MVRWIILPISFSLVFFIGTWTVYGLALSNNHVCSLGDWGDHDYCGGNRSTGCCFIPTISSCGSQAPENSLYSATVNAGSFLLFFFALFHHSHIMERYACHSKLSKFAMVFGVLAAMGGFVAGNCGVMDLPFIHWPGAGVGFTCCCLYTVLLTALTGSCALTGYEKTLYPLRVTSTAVQTTATVTSTVLFFQLDPFHLHLCAIFEWMLTVNLELFILSYAVEFSFFSSFMLLNLLSKRDEEKPLVMS